MTNAGGSDDSGAGGAPQGGPPPADGQQDPWQLVARELHGKLIGLVGMFVPQFPQAELPRVVQFMVREQQMYATSVMRTLVDDQAVMAHPKIEIVMQPMQQASGSEKAVPTGPEFSFVCSKRPTANAEDMLRWLVLMMFVLCPEYRALARIGGFNYELRESRGGPKLWLPGQKM